MKIFMGKLHLGYYLVVVPVHVHGGNGGIEKKWRGKERI